MLHEDLQKKHDCAQVVPSTSGVKCMNNYSWIV